jgi:hypothetical protein
MSPNDPTMAHPTDSMPEILSPLLCFCSHSFWKNSHRSEAREKSRDMVVMQHPAMKRGLILEAPMSEINLIKFRYKECILVFGGHSRNCLMWILRDIERFSDHTPMCQHRQQHC